MQQVHTLPLIGAPEQSNKKKRNRNCQLLKTLLKALQKRTFKNPKHKTGDKNTHNTMLGKHSKAVVTESFIRALHYTTEKTLLSLKKLKFSVQK